MLILTISQEQSQSKWEKTTTMHTWAFSSFDPEAKIQTFEIQRVKTKIVVIKVKIHCYYEHAVD